MGRKLNYQGRKKGKTTNNLVIGDHNDHLLAISDCMAGNHNDSFEIVENIDILLEMTQRAAINCDYTHLNADAGFDVKAFMEHIETKYKMTANIPKNKRNSAKKAQEYRYLGEYMDSFRQKIETIFAWWDTYKRIIIRFDYKAQNFKAWLLIASTLINLRTILNETSPSCAHCVGIAAVFRGLKIGQRVTSNANWGLNK